MKGERESVTKREFLNILKGKMDKKRIFDKTNDVYDAFVETIRECLLEHDKHVNLIGVGKLKIVDVPERTHINPKTKEDIIVPEHKTVKFKISSKLKSDIY